MKIKTFVILLAICGVLAGITYFVVNPDKSSDKKDLTGKELLFDLPVNDIAAISIADKEGEVVLEKGEKVWVVKNRYSYPADFGKITGFAKKIKEMKIGRSFNVSDDVQKRLALFTPGKQDAEDDSKGTRITIKDKSQKLLSDLVLGKPREASAGQGGHYVMPIKEKIVYLVDKDFKYMDKKPEDWLSKELVDVSSEDIAQVVCKDSEGNVLYTLKRPEKGKPPEFVDVPEGKKIISSKLNDVFGALSSLKIDDVADPKLSADKTGFDKPVCFEYSLFDGKNFTACPGKNLESDENKYYFQVKAGYKEPETKQEDTKKEDPAPATDAPAKPELVKDDDAGKEKEADKKEDVKDPAQLAADADELNNRISPWTYVIPKWKAERLISNTEDFFEKPKEETEKKDS